jgi:AcrR family transcriptional regulator
MTALQKREQRKQERHETIIAAAVRVFLERGVPATTMDEIARAADVSKGTLYLYFASKDELLLSVAIEWLDTLEVKLERLRESEFESGLEVMRAGMKLYARHALASPGHFKVAMSWLNTAYSLDEGTPLFQEYRAAIAQKYAFMLAAIERGKADGSVALNAPPGTIAIQLWGGMLGVILVEQNAEGMVRRFPAPAPPTEGVAEAFIDNILAAVGGVARHADKPVHVPKEGTPS